MTRRARTKDRSKPPRVLLVEDYTDAQEMYGDYLTHAGIEVLVANDGKEAIRMASAELPDLILMDLSLPMMDGCEATRILKSNEATKHIPVLAVTGHVIGNMPEKARIAGCDRILAKPCLPDKLLSEVRSLLDR